MAQGVRFVYNESEMERLLRDPEVLNEMLALVEPVVMTSRALAPKDTGAGAASIHGESGVDAQGSFVDISWDTEHDYMRFQDLGTRRIRPHRFLEDALERYER